MVSVRSVIIELLYMAADNHILLYSLKIVGYIYSLKVLSSTHTIIHHHTFHKARLQAYAFNDLA